MNTLRVKEVAKKIGIGQSTVWKWVSLGTFPAPFTLNSKVRVWDEADIDRWLLTSKQQDHGELQ